MRVLLFDMMDTLVADPFYREIRQLAERELFFRWKDPQSYHDFERGEISEPEFFHKFYLPQTPPEILESLPSAPKLKKRMFRFVKFLPGIPEILEWLKERSGIRLGVASNYSAWYKTVLKLRPEIENQFDYLFFSCEMGFRKPQPEFYRLVQESLERVLPGLIPENILFVDDREENLRPAQELGWRIHRMCEATGLQRALPQFLDRGDF